MKQANTIPRRRLFAAGRIPAKRPSVDRLMALADALDGAELRLTHLPLPAVPKEAA